MSINDKNSARKTALSDCARELINRPPFYNINLNSNRSLNLKECYSVKLNNNKNMDSQTDNMNVWIKKNKKSKTYFIDQIKINKNNTSEAELVKKQIEDIFISRRKVEVPTLDYEVIPVHNTMELFFKNEKDRTTTTNRVSTCIINEKENKISKTLDKKLRDKAKFSKFRDTLDGKHHKTPREKINLGSWDVDKTIKCENTDKTVKNEIIEQNDDEFVNLNKALKELKFKVENKDNSLSDWSWYGESLFQPFQIDYKTIKIEHQPIADVRPQKAIIVQNKIVKPQKCEIKNLNDKKFEFKTIEIEKQWISKVKPQKAIIELVQTQKPQKCEIKNINQIKMENFNDNKNVIVNEIQTPQVELVNTPQQQQQQQKQKINFEMEFYHLLDFVAEMRSDLKCINFKNTKNTEQIVFDVVHKMMLKESELEKLMEDEPITYEYDEESVDLTLCYPTTVEYFQSDVYEVFHDENMNSEVKEVVKPIPAPRNIKKAEQPKILPVKPTPSPRKINKQQVTVKTFSDMCAENIPIEKVKQVKIVEIKEDKTSKNINKDIKNKNKSVKISKPKVKKFKAELLTPGQIHFANKTANGDQEIFNKIVDKIYRTIYYKKVTELKDKWFAKTKITNLDLAKANETLKSFKNDDISKYASNLKLWLERVVPKIENDIETLTPKVNKNKNQSKESTKVENKKSTKVDKTKGAIPKVIAISSVKN